MRKQPAINAFTRSLWRGPLAAALLGGTVQAAIAAPQLDTRLLASGLATPVFAAAPLDDGRLFVLEKSGTLQLVQGGVASPFLQVPVASLGEQGLLGLAFDPGYGDPRSAGHRRFFLNYIDPDTRDTVVASWRSSASGLQADTHSRVELLRIDQPELWSNHKAGWIGFKPGDARHLYIATGDGGGAYDGDNLAQNPASLLGKLLRIDLSRDAFPNDAQANYAIPADNPFAHTPGARGEIFALGLRNPWRNGFDRQTGDLWIADVGQGQREEIDLIPGASAGGQNFGWRPREGDIATPFIDEPAPPGLAEPLLAYSHAFGASIIGGTVVREAGSPLEGQYVFGDFISARVWAIDAALAASGGATLADATELTDVLNAGTGGPLGRLSSFGEGARGELLLVDYFGQVLQVVAAAPVPEPGSAALWWLGLAGLAGLQKKAIVRISMRSRKGGSGGEPGTSNAVWPSVSGSRVFSSSAWLASIFEKYSRRCAGERRIT